MKVCHGEFDDRSSQREKAARQAGCAKICGLCRHLNSLEIWTDPNYRRPPQVVLDDLAKETYYIRRRSAAWAAVEKEPT